MNIKNIAATAGATGILLASAFPAFASTRSHSYGGWGGNWNNAMTMMVENSGNINNSVEVTSNTGHNLVSGNRSNGHHGWHHSQNNGGNNN